jgi:hypothetical protein
MTRRSRPARLTAVAGVATAAIMCGWKTGTAQAAPVKPHGEYGIRVIFGQPCTFRNGGVDDHATSWPRGAWNGGGGVAVHRGHALLWEQYNAANWWTANTGGGFGKVNYGVGGYECRTKRGNPDQYSTHAWGIAVDTNTLCNPTGQTYWRGNGWNGPGRCDGPDYGTQLPEIWKMNGFSYINFTWGLGWNDPHHFQYADGY